MLGQVLHLQAALVVGVVAAAAVEKVLVGEVLADVAGLVLGLDHLHHLVPLALLPLPPEAPDDVALETAARWVWGRRTVVAHPGAGAETVEAGVHVVLVHVHGVEELVPHHRLLLSDGQGLDVPDPRAHLDPLDLLDPLARGGDAGSQLASLLEFARASELSFV